MKRKLLILISAFFLLSVTERRSMEWHPDLQLKWRNFEGDVPDNSLHDAETHSGISFGWTCRGGYFNYDVKAYFYPEMSWHRGEPSDRLLEHERRHFDITEIYARKLRKVYSELRNGCAMSKEVLKEKANEVREAWREKQREYDRETHHSTDREAQAKWNALIKAELKKLKPYALH
ncbi:MAG: DUF922 domain-containing protein [Bacteroidota bacterium]